MKKNLLFILAIGMALPFYGQQPTTVADTVTLGEVVVPGAHVINKVDGQQIFPSQIQKSLLRATVCLANWHCPTLK